jgi:hypothetical protein
MWLEGQVACLIWLKINIVRVDMEWHMSYLLWVNCIMCSFIGVPCVMSIMTRLFMVANFIFVTCVMFVMIRLFIVISCIL